MKHVCQILDFDARLQKFIHCKHKTINYDTLYRSQTERKTKQNKKQTKKNLVASSSRRCRRHISILFVQPSTKIERTHYEKNTNVGTAYQCFSLVIILDDHC